MSTLKELVNETTNIKNEIVNCYADLKDNLINMKINLVGSEKMLELIDKVLDIKTPTKVVAGNSIYLVSMTNSDSGSDSNVISIPARKNSYKFRLNVQGSLRTILSFQTSSYSMIINHLAEDGSIKYTKTYTKSSSSYVEYTLDIDNVEETDIIELYCNSSNVDNAVKVKYFYITANIV